MTVIPPRRLALIGLSGSGKTEAGRRVARTLGWPFADADRLVAETAGRSIPELFAAEGEEGFRRRETGALKDLAVRPSPLVASLGGGVVLLPENRKLLAEGFFVVWLRVDPEVAAARLRHATDRPLLAGEDPESVLRSQERERDPLYAALADAQVVSAAGSAPDEVAAQVIRALESAPGPR